MGKTHRKHALDTQHGCFEGYIETSNTLHVFVRTAAGYSRDALEPDVARKIRDRRLRDWTHRNRDGFSSQGSAKATFRKLCVRDARTRTRVALARGRRDGDWDNITFPKCRDGKRFIWAVW
ncbi:hypothetical protein [uncultured Jannaschia sp.]|uniref:hypothetical protein n=1 Tax=uncultured Jannaschia sp. TaxID=293347 RepID=UPI0026297448|nr:hypothetical protein [uncultured Jannaschia sp.]